MPTYDYKCTACGHRFEHFASISQREQVTCPRCGGAVARVYEGRWSVCAKAGTGGRESCGGNCACCSGCGGQTQEG